MTHRHAESFHPRDCVADLLRMHVGFFGGRYRGAMVLRNGGSRNGGSRGERHRGAVTLRREAIPQTTADQRLLDSRTRADWKQKDAWRALRILSEFVEGFDTLADLPPAVSVFGSARVKPDSAECELAERL